MHSRMSDAIRLHGKTELRLGLSSSPKHGVTHGCCGAGAEVSSDKTTAVDSDASTVDEDLEGQLWEQQQALEEAGLRTDALQEKVQTWRLASAPSGGWGPPDEAEAEQAAMTAMQAQGPYKPEPSPHTARERCRHAGGRPGGTGPNGRSRCG